MLSLRALTRSLPRASARIASCSTKSAVRAPFAAASRSQLVRAPNAYKAAFSTSARRCDDTATELKTKLESELALEQDGTEPPSDAAANVQSFLGQNDFWTLHSQDGEQDVMLTRKFDDEDITVAFSIDDFNNPMVGDEDPDSAYADEEDELDAPRAANQPGSGSLKVAPEDSLAPSDREMADEGDDIYGAQEAFPANVTLLIRRAGKGAMRAHLVADEGRWTITSVTHLPESVSGSQSAQELLHNPPNSLYAGPPFQQLDEAVQSMLEAYFEARGINDALAVFVPDYIDVKEQREYQGWLERMKDFVE